MKILYELFYAQTAALVVFTAMELIWPGIVLAYFNINYLLLFWLIVGIIIVVFGKDNRQRING